MDYEKLQELEEENKARIIDTTEEGTVQLWEVDGEKDNYVVLDDNTVITQKEDNSSSSEEAFFPIK